VRWARSHGRIHRISQPMPSIVLPWLLSSQQPNCPERLDTSAKGLTSRPADYQPALRQAAASNAIAGRLEQAQKAMARLRQLNPALRVSNLKNVLALFTMPQILSDTEKDCAELGCRNEPGSQANVLADG